MLERYSISSLARAEASIGSAELIGVTSMYLIICTVFTGVRMCTRFFVHQQLWWDDCKPKTASSFRVRRD